MNLEENITSSVYFRKNFTLHDSVDWTFNQNIAPVELMKMNSLDVRDVHLLLIYYC